VFGKYATGVPWRPGAASEIRVNSRAYEARTQLPVSIVDPGVFTLLGTDVLYRSQKKTLMNDDVRSIAYLSERDCELRLPEILKKHAHHPPPAELNAGPKLLVSLTETPQDSLFVSLTSQLVPSLVLQ
jgi:hypothetical protein